MREGGVLRRTRAAPEKQHRGLRPGDGDLRTIHSSLSERARGRWHSLRGRPGRGGRRLGCCAAGEGEPHTDSQSRTNHPRSAHPASPGRIRHRKHPSPLMPVQLIGRVAGRCRSLRNTTVIGRPLCSGTSAQQPHQQARDKGDRSSDHPRVAKHRTDRTKNPGSADYTESAGTEQQRHAAARCRQQHNADSGKHRPPAATFRIW